MNFSREIALFENLVIVHITLLVEVDPSGSIQHGPTLVRVDPRHVDLEGSRRSTRGWATRSTQVGSTQGVGQRPRCVDPGGWPTRKLTIFVNVAWVSLPPRKGLGPPTGSTEDGSAHAWAPPAGDPLWVGSESAHNPGRVGPGVGRPWVVSHRKFDPPGSTQKNSGRSRPLDPQQGQPHCAAFALHPTPHTLHPPP